MVLWNFDMLWKIRWYYGENYRTIPRTMELRFTKKKNIVDYKN